MKTLFPLLLISVILWGCSKKGDVQPGKSTDTTKITNPISAKPDTTVKLTKDDTLHMAAFIIYAQKVQTSVSGKTLVMAFDENVNIFILAEGYDKTSAVHLKEDWKKTSLAAFDFTTVNEDGQTTFNSIDDNLNNVKLKTMSDTTINGVPVKKINVHRKLTFSKAFGSQQLATDQQNLLLAKTDELITFSSYTYYNQKNYPGTSAVAYLQYLK
jgi:hypothetical protein